MALDAGGATLKASVERVGAARSVGPLLLANVGALAGSRGALVLGDELAVLERQHARLDLVRPVERCALAVGYVGLMRISLLTECACHYGSGYCVNWNVESEIYAHLLSPKVLNAAPSEHSLVVTAPPVAPTVVNESMDQVVFEELGFQAYARVGAPEMCVLSYSEHCRRQQAELGGVAKSPTKKRRKRASPVAAVVPVVETPELLFANSSCHLVVDAGFSFTHVVPVIDGRAFTAGIKRINVGGKLLTNYLKEMISFRQFDVKDDTRIIDGLKHALCYCATDFDADMRRLHGDRTQRKRWVLPDYANSFDGRELTAEEMDASNGSEELQTLDMGVEMITVPEVLFHPSDIGMNQAGIAEAILQAVNACPELWHGALFDNILLVGGSTKFRGFRARLEQDLRPLVPDEYSITLHTPPEYAQCGMLIITIFLSNVMVCSPIISAWQGCVSFAHTDVLEERQVTKQEYEEHGSNICRNRF